ncbi:hypothetical protein TSUD_404660, partial [Trifolium subterraneum]
PNRAQRNPPFDPIPMKYADLLPALLAKDFVQTRPPPPVPAVLPTWYRSDLTCAFHQGAPGHDVERCYALKKAVQELIRNKVLSFKDENPNVRNNPLPNHGSSVHFIQDCQETSTILSVKDVKTPLVPIHRKMCEAKLFSHDHETCEKCLRNPQGCSRVQEDIQRLMDKGELVVTKKSEDVCVIVPEFNAADRLEMIYNSGEPTVTPLVICLPGPMPYTSLRAVPYRYDATMLQDGVEVPIPPLISVDNIADSSKILRSGRILPGVVQEKTDSSVGKTQIPDTSRTSERVYEDSDEVLKMIKRSSFGTHPNGHTMAKKMLRAGYYWLTMESDCYKHARKCHKCQIYADKMHLPPTSLNVLSSPWPFSMWGIDMIGRIEPKASNGHRFILVAIDYFTKWVEAASYANVTKQVVVRFIKNHIICRYGVPNRIITDNGTNLNNKMMKDLCDEFKIEHHNSSPYRPQMNGAVEAANKNIKKIVQKMVVTYKDWHEMLPFALHGYRTSVRTSTGATPFSLVYGMEAVLPIEVEIPSMRVLMETELAEAEWCQNRYDQLNLIEEKRMAALCHGQLYQRRMKQAFDRKVRPREFREGDLVLKKILSFQPDSRGKWTPNYEGPYVVKRAFSGGAMTLATMDGDELPRPVNADAVKKYFV